MTSWEESSCAKALSPKPACDRDRRRAGRWSDEFNRSAIPRVIESAFPLSISWEIRLHCVSLAHMDSVHLQERLNAVAEMQATNPRAAEALLRSILMPAPTEPAVLARAALLLYQFGKTVEALPWMEKAIASEPRAAFYNDYGSLLLAAGKKEDAEAAYRAAIRVEPSYFLGYVNLAETLSSLHFHNEAITCYQQALSLRPTSFDALLGFATVLLAVGDVGRSLAACRAALVVRPGDVSALHTLAVALVKNGSLKEALNAVREALRQAPTYAKGWHTLGNLHDEAGETELSMQAYRRAIEIDPALDEARFDIAALGGMSPPATMPQSYLIRLFDGYAAHFEQNLLGDLDYRVPENLHELVLKYLPASSEHQLRILDLGCGTGLLGKHFRHLAASFVGVDLSAGMLRRAAAAGVYDQLICGDVVDFLVATDVAFDLILAADLFIYMGDLQNLFAASAKQMNPGALLACSIETISSPDSFVLRRTRRYAHSLTYLQSLADGHGFTVLEARPTSIRRSTAGFVDGHLLVIRIAGEH